MKKKQSMLWRATKFIGKVLVVYPAKGLWKGSSYLVQKGRKYRAEKAAEQETERKEQQRPKVEAMYSNVAEVQPLQGTFSSFEGKLLHNKSTIGLILGARGTGKSALGMRLLENVAAKTTKKVYAMGFQPESLPPWISVVHSIDEIKNNSVILIDEGGIEFSSRKAMSNPNKLLSEILLIARHKDLSVIFITQNSANLEINAIRQADYLLLKPSSLLQKDFERKKIKEMYSEVEKEFSELKDKIGLTYVYADNYRGFVTNNLPSFWSEGVSKGYAKR